MSEINYKNDENWLRKGATDKAENYRKKFVDTFYVYPSAYKSSKELYKPFCKIDDKRMRKIAEVYYRHQGSLFEKHSNVFAPYYRQIDPIYGIKLVKEGKEKYIEKYWSKDIINSFKFYIENFNENRPFILAGHSQGSRMLMILLSTFLKENKNIYKRMIAAYIIGETVDEKFLKENPHLKFAEEETDTGVVISWNTEMGNSNFINPVIFDKAFIINPLNWKRDESYAAKELNFGGKLKTGEIVPSEFDAKIDLKRSTLQCFTASPDEYESKLKIFPKGCYHEMDYNFYYKNIQENVRKRIKSYFKSIN